MQFIRIDNFWAASSITGPSHNLLQLRFGSGDQSMPICECLPAIGDCEHSPLDESELIAQILEGVLQANQKLGCNHTVTHIRYIANDTKPETIYGYLALKIVEHIENGGEFLSASKT